MKKKFYSIVGVTPEGRYALSGVYALFETTGLPLDMIVEDLWVHWYVPAWDYFYQEAAAAGVSHRSIMQRIEDSVSLIKRLNTPS